MKPVDQIIFDHNRGDCFRACVASILEVPLEEVPNFMEDGRKQFDDNLDKWLKDQSFTMLDCRILEPEVVWRYLKDCFVIACDESPRSTVEDTFDHAVIFKNGALIHDPHPGGAGLMHNDRPERITLFIMIHNERPIPICVQHKGGIR